MSEQIFKVQIEVDIEYEVGSPPDGTVDIYDIAEPEYIRHTSIWMTKEGPTDGMLSASMDLLYPPFTDATRRTVFCLGSFGLPTITWGGSSLVLGNLFLTTDPDWPTSGVPISYGVGAPSGDGKWFACEGELETDYRVWKQGLTENIAL